MSLYLITGIAGFIGSSIAEALVSRGESVRGVDNLSTGRLANLEKIKNTVDFRAVDLGDRPRLVQACEGVDYIFHQAAIASVPRSIEDPEYSHDANINGTLNILQAARQHKVKRLVYAASSSAYGNQPGQPRVETMRPMPVSPYAVQKVTGEYYLQAWHEVYGLETVSLRYFNIFGPKQDPTSPYSGVLARFIMQMLEGQVPTIFGDGEQARDFTFIENVVAANLAACSAPRDKVAGRVFNIGCGQQFSLNKTYALLQALLDFPQPANYGPPRSGDVFESLADICAAKDAFAYNPRVKYEEGLARTVEWYKGQRRDFF